MCIRSSYCSKPLWILAVCLSVAGPALGLVTHDDTLPADRPPDTMLGDWRGIATCVVVGSDWVLTTQHQAGAVGNTVTIGGEDYQIGAIFNHPTADVRVAWLKQDGQPAGLTDCAVLYEGTAEVGSTAVIGGCGRVRNETLYTTGAVAYGYNWVEPDPGAGPHWGQNRVDGLGTYGSTSLLTADFDGPGRPSAVSCEATGALHDSGGGWFTKDGGDWQVIGLTRGVDLHYADGHEDDPDYRQTWFADPTTGAPAPDVLDAVRVRTYAAWANGIMADWRVPGDADDNDRVDLADLSILAFNWDTASGATWEMGDFTGDGKVDLSDLSELAANWEYGVSVPSGALPSSVPEPASASLLAAAAALLIRRRR